MSAAPAQLKVGAVLFEGFTMLDVFGPLQMLAMLPERPAITMMAEVPGSIRSGEGPACEATSPLSGDSGWDILLVPGGMGTRREVMNADFLAALRGQCERVRYVASVCTGSALLAKAGVLDGKRATSNKAAFAWASSQGPAVRWVARARWVDDGRFFTSSGVSAGMDMALGLIERLRGREAGVAAANRAEYEWHQDPAWDPFAALHGLA